jgi:hypothetical protein
MKIKARATTSLRAVFKAAEDDLAAHITAAERTVTAGVKNDWREQINANFTKPTKLANSIRSRDYPGGARTSLDPAGMIWTKAPKIIDAYVHGAVIRPNGHKFLAIPTADTPKKRQGQPMTPEEVENHFGKRLIFIEPRARGFFTPTSLKAHGVGYLVVKGLVIRKSTNRYRNATANELPGGKRRYQKSISTVVMFILVPEAKVTKRLDLDQLVANAQARYVGLVGGR